jgi:hypothetical protein
VWKLSAQLLTDDQVAAGMRALGVPDHLIRRALRQRASDRGEPWVSYAPEGSPPPRGIPTPLHQGPVLSLHSRLGDRLRLVLNIAPRTKKNGRKGGFGGIKQGPAYRAYRDAIVAALEPLRTAQTIPLPDQPYNIAVTYYVDSHGKTADKCGLDQGLYDALENAGVVTNDWQFRTDDGTRIIAGDPFPRVELIITPIREESHV